MDQQTVRKTCKYKLNPTTEQARELGRVLGLCRTLCNTALEQRIIASQRRRMSVARYAQEAELKDIRAAFPEDAAIHSPVSQDVLARRDKTYQAFFRRLKGGKETGFPRYQGHERYRSFTGKEFGDGTALDTGFLVRCKVGRIAVRGSRALDGAPKTVTISRNADGWRVCFSCADMSLRPLPQTGQETGIDLGIESFATRSDEARIFSPGWYRQSEWALKTAHRRVSRRRKGSHRRRKAVKLLAKAHQQACRQRQGFHHKAALAMLQRNDTMYREDLQTANMVRNHHLAASISDAGWAAFLTILSDNAACAGRSVVAVPPAFTIPRCSGCGRVVWKGLSVRWHHCS
jgi:putative transposase